MKIVLLLALFAALCLARPLEEVAAKFAEFKATYNRQYGSPALEAKAMGCFAKTLDNIDRLNSEDKSAVYGINHFSDICAGEFKRTHHNLKFPNTTRPSFMPVIPKIPTDDNFDWRTKGGVLPIKDQGRCGSCWCFSAVAGMEGAWFVAGHELVSLSEEELVQCADTAGQGCQGGWMDQAVQWVVDHGGINSEEGYPYTSGNGITGECDQQKAAVSVAKFTAVIEVPQDEAQIASVLQTKGPLSIAVDAMDGWQSYRGGIKTKCGGRQLDHGVAIVGFAPDYWIVRNSWGTIWGEQGYIRLKRGVNCDGMAEHVSGAQA